MLRKKMERFNKWETIEQKKISDLDRFQQFLALYDLGKLYDDVILKQTQDNHLMGLVRTNKQLRMATLQLANE